MSKTTGLPLLE